MMDANLKQNLGMTVGQLREVLRGVPDNLPVHFAYNYGDHCSTMVAPPVRTMGPGVIGWSEYCNMPKVANAGLRPEHTETAALILESVV